jgi:hypothetical protein
VKGRYADLEARLFPPIAARAALGNFFVKAPEVQFHHEVYNQYDCGTEMF